ncbi:MAG: glycoside hydrolase [Acidobacteria bacterium]|nr:glycoside hydrolase [Acidobacteriota bacterium]
MPEAPIASPTLRVAILWHFHQPLYVNPIRATASLPWVRLHALKDYHDMAALAVAHPGLELTFNLVPSLVDQLDDLANGRTADPALELASRDAGALTEEEHLAILGLFFSVPYRTLIAPFPRYVNLFHKRGGRGSDGTYRDAARRFKPHDFRDLIVWFHLAWSGETLKRHEVVRGLLAKGEGFTEDDKAALLATQHEFLGGVLPALREIARGGALEFSTSPYYHPILPLLCDSESALEAAPALFVPRPPFRRPADAAEQIRSAVSRHEAVFGVRPRGVWPSEGSLSEETIDILGANGVSWAASDEGILAAALALSGGGWRPRPTTSDLSAAWRLRDSPPALFFRDREISDLVGFTYSSWRGEDAAADLVGRLQRIRDHLGSGAEDAVVPIILDGENAWEHYAENGVPFLSALYRALTSTAGLATTSFSRYLEASPAPRRLERLRAGSWIRSDFTTWIGHPEKNRGWDLLRDARDAFERRAPSIDGADRDMAWKCLQAAEGSDWFWWYGDEHSSEEDSIFDATFRSLLAETWRLLGEASPPALGEPIMGRRRAPFEPPSGAVRVTLDGRRSDYFEWLLAGVCDRASGLGSMSPGAVRIERVAFGWSPGHLFIRVDPSGPTAAALLDDAAIVVAITSPASLRVAIRRGAGGEPSADVAGVACALDTIVEIDVPLAAVPARDGDRVAFSVSLLAAAGPGERLPREGEISFDAAPSFDWSV